MKSINWSKYILTFVLLWLPFLGNYSFADEGKLLYSGPYKDPGVCRDIDTGYESNTIEMEQDVKIYEGYIQIGRGLSGNYSHTTRSGSRVYRGSDGFGNRCTIYVTEDFEIYYDMTYVSQWGSSTCRVELKQL